MVKPVRERATYRDVLNAPEHRIAELVDGSLHISPRPGVPHTVAATMLSALLTFPFGLGRGGPGGWIVLFEPELHLGDDILIPDVAAWRRDRMPEAPRDAYVTLPPDWVCECLSRSTGAIDRGVKLPIYARAGVRHTWLVDALRHTLEVLKLEGDSWRTLEVHFGDRRVHAEPFHAAEIDLGLLWAHTAPAALRGWRLSEPRPPYGYTP